MVSFIPFPDPVGFCSNRVGITLGVVISPTAVWFGRVTCFVLWFLRQTLILPFHSLNTPYNLTVAMCSKYPATGSTTTLKYFEFVVTFTTCSPHWWKHNFPQGDNFTFFPFKIIFGNIRTFNSISFWDSGAQVYLSLGFPNLLQFLFSHSCH